MKTTDTQYLIVFLMKLHPKEIFQSNLVHFIQKYDSNGFIILFEIMLFIILTTKLSNLPSQMTSRIVQTAAS